MSAPICFLRRYDDSVELYLNTMKEGHDCICWRHSGARIVNRKLIETERAIITGLSLDGYYLFWTENSETGEESVPIKIYHFVEFAKDRLERILSILPYGINEDVASRIEEEFASYVVADSSKRDSEIIYDMMQDTENIQEYEKEAFFKIGFAIERYENICNISENAGISDDFKIRYGGNFSVSAKGRFDRIVALKKENGRYKPIRDVIPEAGSTFSLYASDNNFYKVQLWKNGNLVNELHHIQYEKSIQKVAWEEEVEKLFTVEYLLVASRAAGNTIDFTEEEAEYYVTDTEYSTQRPVVPPPVFVSKNNKGMTFQIQDYPLIEALNKPIYLAAKEQDLVTLEYKNCYAKINGPTVTVDSAKYGFAGDIVFYVEDGAQIPLSKFQRYNFEQDIGSYRTKKYLLELAEYEKRVAKNIKDIDADFSPYVDTVIRNAEEDQTTPIEHLPIEVAAVIAGTGRKTVMDALYYLFGDRENNMYLLKEDFLDGDDCITYYKNKEQLTLPGTENGYAAVINWIYPNGTYKIGYYPSLNGAAIDIETNRPIYYYVYMIDRETYRVSGFVLLDKTRPGNNITYSNIPLEVK